MEARSIRLLTSAATILYEMASRGCGIGPDTLQCAGMQVSESIQCPFCGQGFELVIDTSVPTQQFTTDCEICCRPFEVVAECKPGEILSLDVRDS